ncbi:MAG TPA: SapC family protein [Stellaceae bacterium]|nr:SapC family protein [Stellaceae bacterium]
MVQQTAAARSAALPLFYARPSALQPQSHGGLSLKRERNFGFARLGNAIPVTIAEIAEAQRDYPIVFTDAGPPTPVAVVGIEDGVNLMVEEDGLWRPGAYIPAYVQRYPFLFAQHPETQALTLWIDEGADCLEQSERNPLFQKGELGEVTKQALRFCSEYQRRHEATREFSRSLAQAELLIGGDAKLQIGPDRSVTVRGFKIVDEAKLNLLPAETFLNWRARGWLKLIYAHLLSLGGWEKLVHIAKERQVHAG